MEDSLLMREGAGLEGSKESSDSEQGAFCHCGVGCRVFADLGEFGSPGNCSQGFMLQAEAF